MASDVTVDKTPAPPPPIGLRAQLRMMRDALAGSALRKTILWLGAGGVTVIVLTSLMQILLNRWNAPFYDAIERKSLAALLYQLQLFALIAGTLLALGVGQTWLNQQFRLRLRQALTLDLLDEWMRPRRAFRLANAGAIGVNPDQRMQEDAGHLADLTTGLSFGFIQSSILLASFVGILWSISSGFVFHIGDRSFDIPGYMVWAAFLYAGSASFISWLVGRPLIQLNSDRYAREADLRFGMMRVNEHVDAIAIAGGEQDEKRRMQGDLGDVLDAIRRIYKVQIRLEWVTDGYGWLTVIAPILIAAPIYFAGDITFGGLMMAVGAFNQVHSSLRWFINNIGAIADWRATLLRVSSFRAALVDADGMHDDAQRIATGRADRDELVLDRLEVVSPAGSTRLERPKVRIKPGERVLVTGDPNAGKTLLFRALAGLWPWGRGSVSLPKEKAVYFMPRTPYLPPGTLREVLVYPRPAREIADAELKTLLADVGLERLAGSLGRETRWDRELEDDDQRLLSFAQLAVQRPNWVVIDEALDALDADDRRKIYELLRTRLPDAAIVNIGRVLPRDKFFQRRVELAKDKAGPKLKKVDFGSAVAKQAGRLTAVPTAL